MASGTLEALRRAVVWVPDWPVVAAVAEGLAGPGEAVAMHDARGRVGVTSPAARRAGVRRGMRRRSAQQLCPDLLLLPPEEDRDARAFEPVVQAVEDVVAEVAVLRPGVILLPAAGPARNLGSEELLAEALVGAVAEETGAECQVGVADGLLTAMLAAREGVVVPAGASAGFLAGQDVGALALLAGTRRGLAETEELVSLLRRLGLGTLGAFAALDAGDVTARFGAPGRAAHRLARGLDTRPPSSRRPEDDVLAGADLDPPAERADVAAFVARSLAEELTEQMLRRGVVCARLEVSARTEDGAELRRSWTLDDAPTAAELTDRVRWQLDGWLSGRSGRPPSAPLTRLELLAQEVGPAGAGQDGLWGRSPRGRTRAQRAALRVQGLLGPEGVLVPVRQGGRDPRSAVRLVVWGDEAVPLRRRDAPWPGEVPAPWPATVPAVPVPVRLLDGEGAEVRAGEDDLAVRPARLHLPPSPPRPGGHALLRPGEHAVLGWAGPWHRRERWWHGPPGGSGEETGWRAYLQVVPDGLPPLLLVFDDTGWHLDGVYD